jgi:hypothetical protein
MPNLDFATATFALPVWLAGAAAVLFVVIGLLALTRAGARWAGALIRVAAVVMGFAAVWLLLDRAELREHSAARRALDQRMADLAVRAIAPGSALACLDAMAGDTVETACEKAIFASPETVAAAASYMSTRLALLADGAAFSKRTRGSYEGALTTLRLAVETDRFGIVAHLLSVRDSCTPLLCDSFALLHDPDRVQANLRERVFDHYVERYTADWSARAQKVPVAEAPANAYTTAAAPPAAAPAATPLSPKYDFPSAASIPPVSIMNAEPGMPPDVKPAPSAAAAPLPPRRPQHAATPPRAAARAVPAAPQQIAPAPAAPAN